MNITAFQEKHQTMSSFDFLNNFINPSRVEAGEKEVKNAHFIVRVEDELDDLPAVKIFNRFGNNVKYYDLTHEQMMLVGMRESKQVRKVVLEKLKQLSQPKLPQTFAEALQLAADQARLLELQAPKVLFHDTVKQADQTHKLQEAGKKLQQRPNKFCEWLRKEGYTDSKNVPYQRWINQGLFKVHTGVTDQGREYTQGRITGKGLAYFAGKLVEIKL